MNPITQSSEGTATKGFLSKYAQELPDVARHALGQSKTVLPLSIVHYPPNPGDENDKLVSDGVEVSSDDDHLMPNGNQDCVK